MHKPLKPLSLSLALLTIGCAGVVSTQPVGEAPHVLIEEEWEGTWSGDDDFLEVRVVDPEAGHLEAAWIETGDDGFELERVEVWVREAGEVLFGNAFEAAENDEDAKTDESERRYAFFRLKNDGDQIIIWWPRIEAFRELVRAGTLPGAAGEKDDVVLEALSAEQLALLASDDSRRLWDWQNPGVLVR